MKNKKNILISSILILLSILFTIIVKLVDVRQVGEGPSNIGLSTINSYVFKTLGVNNIWYDITSFFGVIAILIAVVYVFIGFIQLIKRKSLLKVDKEIIILGLFYIVVVGLYVFFEKFIINYRPILMDGALEASYPSSHTLMVLCLCGSSIMINKKLYNNRVSKYMNICSTIIMVVMVVGRLLAGVHWFTDIIGGILISMALLMVFYTVLCMIDKKD